MRKSWHIQSNGTTSELGQGFSRPGVGIVADGAEAVLAVDNGANVIRRLSLSGETHIVVENLGEGVVALARASDGSLLIGTWGKGALYRAQQTN